MKKLFIFFVAAAMIVAFTVPAAADWNFYGHVRMHTDRIDVSKEATSDTLPRYDDEDTNWDLAGNARIGANVETGDIKGRFEYGTGVNLRLLYGDWNFGAGTLRIGQFYTPTTYFYSNQSFAADDGLFFGGNPYGGRLPGIQLKFGGFKVAFLRPNAGGTEGFTDGETDTTLPKIEVSYKLPLGPAALDFYGGYNDYDEVDALDSSEGVTAYHLGVGGTVNAGPATIAFRVYQTQNPNAYGFWSGLNAMLDDIYGESLDSPLDAAGTGFVDIDEQGGCLVVGFKASDALSFEGGVGYAAYEGKDAGVTIEMQVLTYYVQAKIVLADNFFIVPEIGKWDYGEFEETGEPGVDLGELNYYGIKWEMRF